MTEYRTFDPMQSYDKEKRKKLHLFVPKYKQGLRDQLADLIL